MNQFQYQLPNDIERQSMATIGEELEQMGAVIPAENEAVVKRVIHTTADFDYAKNLVFTPQAVARALSAMKEAPVIVTDTNMALAGINKTALAQVGGEVRCFMADADVAESAKAKGTTRATAAVDKAVSLFPGAIFVCGNAPTALIRLAQIMRDTDVRPALIVGVPVGFVNVVESKEEILALAEETGVPAIVARGRKGGSNVAAAICNALLYQAVGRRV